MKIKTAVIGLIFAGLLYCSCVFAQMSGDFESKYYQMGLNYLGSRDYAKAAKYFQKVISINPSNSPAHYNLGVTYKYLGRQGEARIEFEKASKLKANSRTQSVLPNKNSLNIKPSGYNSSSGAKDEL